MSALSESVIYQLKIVLLGISPMIWRRILVSSDSTIEDLHYTVQLAMGWSDIHLHHFIIYGKQYGITQPGGTVFSDCASEVKLASFGWRIKEKFLYENGGCLVDSDNSNRYLNYYYPCLPQLSNLPI